MASEINATSTESTIMDSSTHSTSSQPPNSAAASNNAAAAAAAPKNANAANANGSTPSTTTKKVKVHFVPVGSAPIMKKNKFQLSSDQRFASVQLFLRKMLKLKAGDSLWLYCNSAFLPSPNEFVGDLNDCFAVRGELQIQYSLQEAWG